MSNMTEVEMSISQRVPACEAFSDNSLERQACVAH